MSDLSSVEILTFDCYGTLIDWETGLRTELERLRGSHALRCELDDLLSRWEAIQFEMITGPYRTYREILDDSLRETFAREGITLNNAEAQSLRKQIGVWRPFSDTVGALTRLAGRYRLGILSNIDDDMLAQSVAQMRIPFEHLITAAQVKHYKPAPAHFEEAIRRFDRPAESFLHCAFGFKYDQLPALQQGMQTVWVKRPCGIRDAVAEPTYETDSLEGLAQLLGV